MKNDDVFLNSRKIILIKTRVLSELRRNDFNFIKSPKFCSDVQRPTEKPLVVCLHEMGWKAAQKLITHWKVLRGDNVSRRLKKYIFFSFFLWLCGLVCLFCFSYHQ